MVGFSYTYLITVSKTEREKAGMTHTRYVISSNIKLLYKLKCNCLITSFDNILGVFSISLEDIDTDNNNNEDIEKPLDENIKDTTPLKVIIVHRYEIHATYIPLHELQINDISF